VRPMTGVIPRPPQGTEVPIQILWSADERPPPEFVESMTLTRRQSPPLC
jgi:hypothetical protein